MKKFNSPEELEAFELGKNCVKLYIAYCLEDMANRLPEGEGRRVNLCANKIIWEYIMGLNNFLINKGYIPNSEGLDFEGFCSLLEKKDE